MNGGSSGGKAAEIRPPQQRDSCALLRFSNIHQKFSTPIAIQPARLHLDLINVGAGN